MWKRYPIHPMIFGLVPLVSQLVFNWGVISPDQFWRPAVIIITVTLIVYALLIRLLKQTVLAAVITSLASLGFFVYGHLQTLLLVGITFLPFQWEYAVSSSALNAAAHSILLLLLALLGWVVWMGLRGSKGRLEFVSHFMSILAPIALIVSIAQIIFLSYKADLPPTNQPEAELNIDGKEFSSMPDIYYIVLDGYGRADVLEQNYDFDNQEFINDLQSMGFWVASSSHSNYTQTILSLASTLNFNYLDALLDNMDPELTHGKAAAQATSIYKNNQLVTELEAKGYKTIAFASGYFRTELRQVDMYLQPDPSEFTTLESMVSRTSGLKLIEDLASWVGLNYPYIGYEAHRQKIRYTFEKLPAVANNSGPEFVFAHLLIPHPPFVFAADGSSIQPNHSYALGDASDFPQTRADYVQGYQDQIQFINDQLSEILPRIIEDSDPKPIIILQGDHGPAAFFEWESPSDRGLKERFSILNAIYLPMGDPASWGEDLSSVNTFRLIFNEVFGSSYRQLPDQVYFSPSEQPFRLTPVPPSLLAP